MIAKFGWSSARERAFVPLRTRSLVPAHVIARHRGLYRLMTAGGECTGTLSGRFTFDAAPGYYPVTGDWTGVALRVPIRRPSRKAVGGAVGQIVAANVDLALLVMSMNADFSLRLLERYLVATREGGARPLVLLTKADLCADAAPFVAQCRSFAADVDVLALSVVTKEGMTALIGHLARHDRCAARLFGCRQVEPRQRAPRTFGDGDYRHSKER
jgi:ribosome biogenesis GTPase